jgi:hypothetical protein
MRDAVGMTKDDINDYYEKMMSELSYTQKKEVEIDNDMYKVLQFQDMMLKQLDFVDKDPDEHSVEPVEKLPKTIIKLRKRKQRPSIGKEFDPKLEFARRRSAEASLEDWEDILN